MVKVWHVQDLIDTTTESTSYTPLARVDNVHDMGVFSIDISKHIDVDGKTCAENATNFFNFRLFTENNPLIRYYSMATSGYNHEIKLWTITSKALVRNKNVTHNEVTIELKSILDGHNSSVTCVR